MNPQSALLLVILEAAALGYAYYKGFTHDKGKDKEKKDKKE